MEAQEETKLGRFGHHPSPAVDFCVEVDALEGEVYEAKVGLVDGKPLLDRIARALEFRVGGDPDCVRAKAALRRMQTDLWIHLHPAWPAPDPTVVREMPGYRELRTLTQESGAVMLTPACKRALRILLDNLDPFLPAVNGRATGPTGLTAGQLKAKLDTLPPETLAQEVIWSGEMRGGIFHGLTVTEEDQINPSGDGCEPVSLYRSVLAEEGKSEAEIAEFLADESVVIKKGQLVLLVDR